MWLHTNTNPALHSWIMTCSDCSVILFQLYSYDETPNIIDPRFYDRLHWNGSKKTKDLQDGSIYILNVTLNDTGTYRCIFSRTLIYPNHEHQTNANKTFFVKVVPRRKSRGEGGGVGGWVSLGYLIRLRSVASLSQTHTAVLHTCR